MKSRSLVLAALLIATLGFVLPANGQGGRGRQRRTGPRWAPDGVHLIVDDKWIEPLTGAKTEAKEREAPASPPAADARAALADALRKSRDGAVPTRDLRGRPSRSTLPRTPEPSPGAKIAPDGSGAVVILDGDLWGWRKGEDARVLRKETKGARRIEIAPNAAAASYILANDLYVTRVDDGTTHRLSDDGSEDLFYGELDWVYQEEVYGRGKFKGTWWSPTGAHLAFMRIDESGVDTFTVVDHIPDALELEPLKYPKAGSTNPRASLHVADAKTGKTVAVDLSTYDAKDEILVVRVGWTPDGRNVFYMIQNREQTWLDLCLADPATGKAKTLVHETAPHGWVNVLAMPRWLEDGSFLWESERTVKHLYRYDLEGKLHATITSGEWEVRRIVKLDEKGGWIAYSGSKDSAVGLHVYRSKLDGSGFRTLTEGRGTHAVSFNGDGSLLVDTFSSLENPGEVWLRRADGTAVRRLDERKSRDLAGAAKLHRIRARDGELLDVTVQKPKSFDENGSYPVWIDTYSGPDAPSVRDSWGGGRSSWYTNNGMILLRVNVRSASGRGMKYTSRCYRQFGVQELQDLEDAVTWLTSANSWADASRVGISGWSYGGFMAAYALTHSKMFKCGVAGAGVYDWRLYDTIYTERYMATPQNNEEGYDVSSVVKAAKDLHGDLLIVHGTMDDNVHMQNAIQLVDALQKAGKQNFEFMLYPKSRHGVRSPHLAKLRQRFILEHIFSKSE